MSLSLIATKTCSHTLLWAADTTGGLRRQKGVSLEQVTVYNKLLGDLILTFLPSLPCLPPTPRHFFRTSWFHMLPTASHYLASLSVPFHAQETYLFFSPSINQSTSILFEPYHQTQLQSSPWQIQITPSIQWWKKNRVIAIKIFHLGKGKNKTTYSGHYWKLVLSHAGQE